ncbi:hypothetical protein ETU08_01740 [Apibacter muscae]|uniref:Uncharacterized protein n=1 Tax=Apibacter muscae TaxID=2509004 RepID=A0A563DJU9_9FLAO|nr:hypothetical protein [Apibacter muscae]TWP30506.1 hypothetical protein ETU09_00465 [Apibacter muscae]TWP31227.1 hypothetical protein ETU08_01740 [Apibacter muscae]
MKIENRQNPKAELRSLLKIQAGALVPIQTYWAITQEVDWENKTMTAIGVSNELPFYKVLLGLGSLQVKPKVGSPVLLGVIENQTPLTFLLDSEQVEEVVYTSGSSQWVINPEGFQLSSQGENLYQILGDYIEQFGKLADEINKIKVAIGTSPNTPVIAKIKQEVTGTIKQRLNTLLK